MNEIKLYMQQLGLEDKDPTPKEPPPHKTPIQKITLSPPHAHSSHTPNQLSTSFALNDQLLLIIHHSHLH